MIEGYLSDLAGIQAPTLQVRNSSGEIVGKITGEAAANLITRGWATPIGRRHVKYLLLSPTAPWKPTSGRKSPGTRPVRADQTCNRPSGSLIGNPRVNREFIPV